MGRLWKCGDRRTGRVISVGMLRECRIVNILDFEPPFDATRKHITFLIEVSLLSCRLLALGLLYQNSPVEGRLDGWYTLELRYVLLFFQVQTHLYKHRWRSLVR